MYTMYTSSILKVYFLEVYIYIYIYIYIYTVYCKYMCFKYTSTVLLKYTVQKNDSPFLGFVCLGGPLYGNSSLVSSHCEDLLLPTKSH